MAEEVPISGGPEQAKIRSIFGPIFLTIITLGIYGLVWWYKINREMADLGRKRGTEELGTNPTLSLLAMFPGAILVVPLIWTSITTYQRIKRSQQHTGVEPDSQANPWIFGIMYFFLGFIVWGYMQNELNKVWRRDSGQLAAPVAAPAVAAEAAATPARPEPPAAPEPPAPPPPPQL